MKIKFFLFTFMLFICSLTLSTLTIYPGKTYIYLIFTITFNFLLFYSIRKNNYFFEIFIAIFFWLGCWLKFSYVMTFCNGRFIGPIGNFNKSPESYDHVLLVATCSAAALILACKFRMLIFPTPSKSEQNRLSGLFYYYQKYGAWIWGLFIVIFVTIALINLNFGIYQRGLAPKLILPMKLGGVFTWLLLFGMASFSALLLNFEFKMNNKPSIKHIFFAMLEGFCSNVSMLSRGMPLNMGSLLIGLYKESKNRSTPLKLRYTLLSLFMLAIMTLISAFAVNYARPFFFSDIPITQRIQSQNHSQANSQATQLPTYFRSKNSYLHKVINDTTSLLIHRWVGIEAIMSVSSYSGLGMNLFFEALNEEFKNNGTSFYDIKIAKSTYTNLSLKNHHITLPGITGFFYYPGSFIFLFIAIFTLGIFASTIEFITYKLSGANAILCSLISQVIAYRYVHFGYAPKQSYLLFGAILLNIFIIYLLNKIPVKKYNYKDNCVQVFN